MKSLSKLFTALLVLAFFVTPAFAQKWSMPGKGTPVPCTTCIAPATGKLTFPFNDPLMRHVGRYVDSSTVGNVQNAGMRTVRARVIRTYPQNNRIAIALGETVGLYKLDTFFTTKLPAGMVNVNTFKIRPSVDWTRYSDPYEKLSMPDRYFYAEAKDSEWTVSYQDSQRLLNDFDMDDRGLLYVTTIYFGWGLGKDDGTDGGTHVDFVTQVTDTPFAADSIFSLKSGAKYYAVISTAKNKQTQIYDVTAATPGFTPSFVANRDNVVAGIRMWAKDEDSKRLALVNTDGKLRIYDYSAYITGGAAVAEYTASSGRSFGAISFDESGRLWAAESSAPAAAGNLLWRLSPSGAGYAKQTFDVYDGAFAPVHIHAAGGYVAVFGGSSLGYDVALLKVDGGTPQLLDLNHFFRNYYYKAPSDDYVALDFRSPSTFETGGVQIVEQGNKTYLMFSGGGLADVFEIQSGESIAIQQVAGPYGTANPNARSTEDGPFYGDLLKFKATSNSPSANYSIDWDFGNPDAGTENFAQSGLNENVTHQFTGLNTSSEVQAVKKVKASVSSDASIADELSVTLKLPAARITVPGFTSPMTQTSKQDFEVVAGDTFKDASDGVVEGHFASWSIDGAKTNALPNASVDVGDLGSHTLALTAYYGKYNSVPASTAPAPTGAYAAVVSNISYTVKPFIATIKPPVTTTTDYKFSATARVTSLTNILSATQWTVTWSLESGSNSNVVSAQEASTVDVGTIPDYIVPRSSVHDGDTVKLQISVDPSTVPSSTYATYVATQELLVPEFTVQKTGCANAGDPCTLTVNPAAGSNTALWQIQWTVKRGTTTVETGTGLTLTFTPSQSGSYTATAKETSYNVSEELPFTVAAATCNPVPEEYMVDITTDCGSSCTADTPILFEPSIFGYAVQPCDTFTWTFSDTGSTVYNGRAVSHTFANNGTYVAKLTIKNNNPISGSRTWQKNISIGGGNNNTCVAPVAITVSYSGPSGCGAVTPCKAGDGVKFTALKAGSSLQTCDVAHWSVDGQPEVTTKSPTFTFTSTGAHTVTLYVSNELGQSPTITTNLTINPGSSQCSGSAAVENLAIEYSGATSSCSNFTPSVACKTNEVITFTPTVFGYVFQPCDKFEWDFGDGTKSTLKTPTKTYTAQANSYVVKLKVYNASNPTGVTIQRTVPFANVPIKPTPKLEYVGFPTTGTTGVPVTFNVKSDINATNWVWDFNDGVVDTSQSGNAGKANAIAHTFGAAGTYSVKVTARNAEDTPTAPTSFAVANITITDTPEFRYLLPVVTHGPGQNGSVWRTDVQVYNPDPNVSSDNPLVMKASLRNLETTLNVTTSTYIYEDFMQRLTNSDDAGPVIISTRSKYAPQLWTRTYNQAENGTFGQFIPAIRLDNVGSGNAIGEGMYYLAGLRNDDRYRTNIGFVNPTLQAVNATVRVYDEERRPIAQFTKTLPPFELVQFPIKSAGAVPDLPSDRAFSIEIEVPAGQWVVAYASFIDSLSNDPVFIQAVRDGDLASEDYAKNVIPGVGHTGQWRSDVTIFNPDDRNGVNFDLTYYDQSGVKKAEAKNIFLGPLKFLQYEDLLKQGVLGNVEDGLGVLHVQALASTIPNNRYPMTFSRTYFDNGANGTYGQGIGGFATARANVKLNKPALIPAVRSDARYYTNVGLTNLTDQPVTVTVTLLNPQSGTAGTQQQYQLAPNQSVIGTFDFAGVEQATLKVETNGGAVWAFASVIDKNTKDPEYVAATAMP